MAKITDSNVHVAETGQTVLADCSGNNAAVVCPSCVAYPVLLIALPGQQGSPQKPALCRHCGARMPITDDVAPGRELTVLNLAIQRPQGSMKQPLKLFSDSCRPSREFPGRATTRLACA